MELTRRNLLKGAAALGAAGAVPATLAFPAIAQTTQKKGLGSAQAGDISKFDPHFSTSSNDIRVSFNIFDNLTSRHPDGKLYRNRARVKSKANTGAQAAPGRQVPQWRSVHVGDAKWSLERTFDPPPRMVATVFTTIDRIEAPDAMTLVIHTKKPDPLLPGRLAFYGGQIVPKKYVESAGNDGFNAKPVGTGPIRFVSWVKDDKAVFDANPDYWGGKIDVDRWIMRRSRDGAAVAAVLKGEVDIITRSPPIRASASTPMPRPRSRARSTRASTCSASTASGRPSTTRWSSRRCPSPSTARPS